MLWKYSDIPPIKPLRISLGNVPTTRTSTDKVMNDHGRPDESQVKRMLSETRHQPHPVDSPLDTESLLACISVTWEGRIAKRYGRSRGHVWGQALLETSFPRGKAARARIQIKVVRGGQHVRRKNLVLESSQNPHRVGFQRRSDMHLLLPTLLSFGTRANTRCWRQSTRAESMPVSSLSSA